MPEEPRTAFVNSIMKGMFEHSSLSSCPRCGYHFEDKIMFEDLATKFPSFVPKIHVHRMKRRTAGKGTGEKFWPPIRTCGNLGGAGRQGRPGMVDMFDRFPPGIQPVVPT